MKLNRYCYKCTTIKLYPKDFYKNQWVCKPCHAQRQREYRRTLRGFLDQKYTAMSKRVRGKDKNCVNTSKGLPILSRIDFLNWSFNQPELKLMFDKYRRSGFLFKYCPTIDRINPNKGYLTDNMQYLYQTDNAQKHRENWELFK